MDIIKDMDSANYIPAASRTSHYRQSLVTLLFLRYGDLLEMMETLNSREPLSGNNTTNKVVLIHIFDSPLQPHSPMELLFGLEDLWMAINAKFVPMSRSDFAPVLFYSYELKNLNNMGDFH